MHKKFPPPKRNGQTLKSSLTTLAVAVMLTGVSLDANALALGEINVYSALGQPFRAEVDVTQLSPQEANSLRATIASPAGYKSAGIEYNPAVASIRVSVQKRANGKTFLRLSSQSPIHEPYLGVVVDTNWSSGRVVRDFTVLLDPPETRRTSVEVTPAQTTALPPLAPRPAPAPRTTPAPRPAPAPHAAIPSTASVEMPPPQHQAHASTETQSERDARLARAMAQVNGSVASSPAPVAQRTETRKQNRRRSRTTARVQAQANTKVSTSAQASGDQVNVKRGDTAGRLAAANLPANVSLDQMLVAMLRANPDAFIGGNVNRLRAGAVLTLPTATEASAVSRGAARKTIVAQSRDFNRYRQGLGRNAPRVKAASTRQTSSGKVQTEIKAPTTVTQDGSKLVVNQPSSKDASKADAIAKKAELDANNKRMAELERTRKELEALTKASQEAPSAAAPTPATAPAAKASAPGIAVPITAPASNSVDTPAPATSDLIELPPLSGASESASAAMTTASEAVEPPVAEAPPPAKPKPRPLPPPEPSFMDGVMDNILPLGLGALAVLGGLGFLAVRGRKKKTTAPANAEDGSDSEFIESRLQPDSFFNASGGQQVNTQAPRATGNATSMAYSPSQLDAAGDVDPVAEADVYLAYGRDMQAEEILKEALQTTPERIAIHRKLLEIYAKRRDTKAFEELAKELRKRTGGQGEDWLKIADLGNELDPGNPLYKGNGDGAELLSTAAPVTAAPVFGSSTLPSPDGLDDDELDLELNGDSRLLAEDENSHLDKPRAGGLATFNAPPETKAPDDADTRDQPIAFDMDFDAPPSIPATEPSPVITEPASLRANLDANEGMLEFDMSALNSLNTEPESRSFDAQDSVQPDEEGEDPLSTKLSLAREFHAIGDTEGARALVKEVINEADGAVKARAERFLSEL